MVVRTERDGTIITDSYNGKKSTRRTTLLWPRTIPSGSGIRRMAPVVTTKG
jgi:hypothetical protein